MTLVTAAMSTPPTTPGGEALVLGDLLAVDPQVTFDNVARRIARLKIFRVLTEIRSFRKERSLDPDEPMFKNPNALLRRLVRDGRLTDDIFLDPWGGTIQFTRTAGPPIPFLSVIHGFELHAPGPDGVVGNGDDVRDPFERVLRSGTPYADAVSEDRIVDARFDLEVGDATVSAWQTLFEELTGSKLGGDIGGSFGAGGLGLSGIGGGGGRGGRGEGVGLGRGSAGIATGASFWSVPKRTDDRGHVRIHVPLGDIETTWRIALVGVPDGARPATTTVDVPVALPLSARVDAVEAAARIERWAVGREGDGSTLGKRAAEIGRRAQGRIAVYSASNKPRWSPGFRLAGWSPAFGRTGAAKITCLVSSGTLDEDLDVLDAEPGPVSGAALSCWDAFVTTTLDAAVSSSDPVDMARALLALAERQHRGAVAAMLADRLRARLALRPSGGISVEGALLASGIEQKGATTATVTASGVTIPVEVGPAGHVVVPLEPAATSVKITVRGPGVIACFERPAIRSWSRPPESAESPIRLAVTWPENARSGSTGVVRVDVRHSLGRSAMLDIRLPLPPAVTLAERVSGVQQIQGLLALRRSVDQSSLPTVIEIPVRFGLGFAVTVPEARATVALEDVPRAVAPSRPLVVR